MKTTMKGIICLLSVLLFSVCIQGVRITPDTPVANLPSPPTGVVTRTIAAGATGTITVNSPWSANGAAVEMWGFYNKVGGGWVNATFGTGTIMSGTCSLNYTVPTNYLSDFMWEVDVNYNTTLNDVSCWTNENGVWGQFENYDPNGTTMNFNTYMFDQRAVYSTSVSYRVSAQSGTVFPNPALSGSVLYVKRPWTGLIANYNNDVYNNSGYGKTGLSPTYAMNKGYSIDIVATNPTSPDFQEVHLYKNDIGYSVYLFGYKNASTSDPLGYIWWCTLVTDYNLNMDYNGTTGVFSKTLSTPLALNTMYFLDPWVYEYFPTDNTRYFYIVPGGGTDLLLSGAMVPAPVNNVTRGIGYNTIQAAIDASSTVTGDIIVVSPGTYNEDINISKSIIVRGTAAATTTIVGQIGGNSQTVFITANNVLFEKFTVTRAGNNVTDWNNAGLNTSGIQITNAKTGCTIQNCIVTGNRNAIYLNDTQNHTIQNNVIDFNRTGLQLVNNISGCIIQNNQITNNWTLGMLFYYAGVTTPSTGTIIRNNNISGNWYSQAECKINGSYTNPTTSYNCSPNWWGVSVPSPTSTLANEPGYAGQIPTAYGGTATNPGGNDGKISGQEYAKIYYDPWWANSGMTVLASNSPVENMNNSTFYSNLKAAIAAAAPNDVIHIAGGTFAETGQIVINKNLTIVGSNGARTETIITPTQNTTNSGDSKGWFLVQDGCQFNLSYVTLDGAGWNIYQAIRSYGSGTIDHCVIKNIGYNPSGPDYAGTGVVFFGNYSMTVSNNILSNIGRQGIFAFGSGVTAGIISGNTYTGKGVGNWLDYAVEIGGGAVASITGNTFTNCKGIASVDGSTSAAILVSTYYGAGTTATITGNPNISNNSCGIAIGYDSEDTSVATVSGNTFSNNPIQVTTTTVTRNVAAILAGNTYDHAFLRNQTIYSTTAEMLYVDAPKTLIQDSEMQVYSVKALHIDNLRGFTTRIIVPKIDFAEPLNFTIGSAFTDNNSFFVLDYSDATNWIYEITGSINGGVTGITGDNVVFFTLEITSLPDANNVPIPGRLIDLPLDSVELRDANNPYNSITCLSTEGIIIIIDSSEPTIVQNNPLVYPSGMILPIDPVATVANGYPSVTCPVLNLTVSDDYNINYAKYLIQGSGAPAPTAIAGFASATDMITSNFAGATSTFDFTAPAAILNAAVNNLADGSYTIYFLGVDDAGNYVITSWSFVIDKSACDPVTWVQCRVTPNANNSIDLSWTNPVGAVRNQIWVLDYDFLASANGYPEYNPVAFSVPAIPVAPNPYNPAVQNGWTKMADIAAPTAFPYAFTITPRGYYYLTVFAVDTTGNISAAPAAPFYRQSLSYWPGDVTATADTSQVTIDDIAILSTVWGLTSASGSWNPIVDVGPSTDHGRLSRPCPDDKINIEDLMMFSMNWENTNYYFYGRNSTDQQPVRIALQSAYENNLLRVDVRLADNNSTVKGLDIPFNYGSGLTLQSVTAGPVWSEHSLLLYTNENNILDISCSELGGDTVVEGNGIVFTAYFAVNGNANSLALQHMTARDINNADISIVNNPGGTTPNGDQPTPKPVADILGNNYPNPFNPATTINFGLKDAGAVRISIFNTQGQLVKTLVNTNKAAGYHTVVWDGTDNNNHKLASGVYFYRMETKNHAETKKAILLK